MPRVGTRNLTVKQCGDRYRQRTGRQAPKSKIDLMGCWLHEAGFKPGDRVIVSVAYGQLTITIEEPQSINT